MRILFYYHHFGGFGHGMRVFSLCKALKKLNPQYRLLVVNSGFPQPELSIESFAHVINLPYFTAKKGLFSGLDSPLGLERAFHKRRKMLFIIAEKFRPHVAFFEHFPFGRDALGEEIAEFIGHLRSRKAAVYSIVRDIIVHRIESSSLDKHIGLLDGVIVLSSKDMGFITPFEHSERLWEKIFFTGRVFPEADNNPESRRKVRQLLGNKRKKLVVVSIGGGIDGEEIIEDLIDKKEIIDREVKTVFFISTGTSISKEWFTRIKYKVQDRAGIFITKFVSDYLDYINAADLSISRAGYNAVNNALFTTTPTIVIPRLTDKEQLIRAQYFRNFLDVLSEYSPEELIRRIKMHLKRRKNVHRKGLRADCLSGASVFARLVDRIEKLHYIKIRLHTLCNCQCDMCTVRLRRGEVLDYGVVKSIINDAKILNIKIVNFTGGEPTLHRDFKKILFYTKEKGFEVSVSTNGIVDNLIAEDIARVADYVDVSFNAADENAFDRIRGKKGAWRRSLSFLKYLRRRKRRIYLHVNVTVRPDNFLRVYKVIPLLGNILNSISFTLVDTSINRMDNLIFSSEELIQFYFKEVPRIIKGAIKYKLRLTIRPFFKEFASKDNKNILAELNQRENTYRQKLGTVFDIEKNSRCLLPFSNVRVNANGEVVPCCYLDDYENNLGNVNKERLIDILCSERYFSFMQNAFPGKGICNKCKVGYRFYSRLLSK